jgi:uncharacterized membrane protein HdeD (DUF308 family)
MSYPEKQRSNWWYLAPILAGVIGGIIAYFVLRNDDPVRGKTCICISITMGFGFIGGIVSYFILRKDNHSRAKLFLYTGIILGILGIVLGLIVGPTDVLDPDFNVNV